MLLLLLLFFKNLSTNPYIKFVFKFENKSRFREAIHFFYIPYSVTKSSNKLMKIVPVLYPSTNFNFVLLKFSVLPIFYSVFVNEI